MVCHTLNTVLGSSGNLAHHDFALERPEDNNSEFNYHKKLTLTVSL